MIVSTLLRMIIVHILFGLFSIQALSNEIYVVTLFSPKDGASDSYLDDHFEEVKARLLNSDFIIFRYSNLLKLRYYAYSASLNKTSVALLESMEDVNFVEKISTMKVASSKKGRMARTAGHLVPKFSRPEVPDLEEHGFCSIDYPTHTKYVTSDINSSELSTINAYVLDTGVQSSHMSLRGKVVHGADFISPDFPLRSDPHGHGTQIAGIIAGREFGVSRVARVVDVRVMDAHGTGWTDTILAGLDYAVGKYLEDKDRDGPLNSVICMSISGLPSLALRHALYFISDALLVVSALGDSDRYSCLFSPVDSPYTLSVGALDQNHNLLSGANFGDCVDMYAPGENIAAPFIGDSDSERKSLTGSSASAAIVTGFITYLLSMLRSPNVVYKKSGDILYSKMQDVLQKNDYSIFVRNVLLTNESSRSYMKMCKILQGDMEQAVSMLANIQLQEIDPSSGRPMSVQKLENFKNLNARKQREKFYTS